MSSSLLVGDCRAVMASMPPDTFDSIVTIARQRLGLAAA